eukprot:GFUD01008473.1.p1 GENE.GFUD01008473.1~~GFUD01008473.1.p1  ORF type:complete len:486 (-),score=115.48 GFUD01008473.1:213-1670(-)
MTDMHSAAAMADHFDKINKLPNPVEGVPNFRCVPGYQVYCCGQPTVAGFENALNKVTENYPKNGPIIWINMRQEPSVYVNGSPMCARPPNKIGEYAELGNITSDMLENDEVEFVNELKSRAEANGGKIKYQDCLKTALEIEAKEIIAMKTVVDNLKKKFPGLVLKRAPVCNSGSPRDSDYDLITGALEGSKFNAPVIINCQVGLARSTTGCVIACLFREYQVSSSFSGLISTVPGLNLALLKMDTYEMDMEKDPLFRGEFKVVLELLEKYPNMVAAKNQCDKLIDMNGPKSCGGTGIKQLRENIAESKLSYEIMDDAAQAFLKTKIQDNITKYFMLVVFSGYLREKENAPAPNTAEEDIKLPKKFGAYMQDNSEMTTMIQKGKGKLQWERDIPADVLARLESLSKTDFKGNMSEIIHDILGAANKIFRDMADVGDHKKRAKYRFSSKTLMTVLPTDLQNMIEDMIEKGTITMDFYEILGEVQRVK